MSEWISVKDELPLRKDRLLLVEGADEPFQAVGYFNRLSKCYIVNGESYPGLCVTYWQRLPDPPKEAA